MKGSRFYSITKQKCPNCQEGNFFEGSLLKATPKEKCDVCNFKFEKEPGFFQGSYYVSYALGVATIVFFAVATLVLWPSGGFNGVLIVSLLGLLLSVPILYPLSKIIWANFFYGYDKNWKEKLDK